MFDKLHFWLLPTMLEKETKKKGLISRWSRVCLSVKVSDAH